MKKVRFLGSYPKGPLYKNTVYLERGMPYFCICSHKFCASYALIKDYN